MNLSISYTEDSVNAIDSLNTIDFQFLRSLVLFKNVTEEELKQFVLKMEIKKFERGDPIFLEGDQSASVYFVHYGNVEIVKQSKEHKTSTRIRKIGKGEHISELSILTNSRHSTSCFAIEETELYLFSGEQFKEILSSSPVLTKTLLVSLASQVQGSLHNSYYARSFTPEQMNFDKRVMRLIPMEHIAKSKVIPLQIVNQSIHVAMVVPFDSDFFAYFEENSQGYSLQISTIEEEDYEKYRKLMLKAYHGERVEDLIGDEAGFEGFGDGPGESYEEFFEFSMTFSGLGVDVLEQIKPYVKLHKFKQDEIIFKAGSKCEGMYIIKKGKISLVKEVEEHPLQCHVETRDVYDIIGESSLLVGGQHTLQASAEIETEAYFLPRQVFDELLKTTQFSLPLAMGLAKRLQSLNRLPGVPLNLSSGDTFTSMTEMTTVGGNINDIPSPVLSLDTSGVDKALNQILEMAVETRASDLHLEHKESNSLVRFRIDGVMNQLFKAIPLEFGGTIVNRIKVLAQLDITEKRRPQDGQFASGQGKDSVEVRVSTVPTRYGEKVVLRLLRKQNNIIPISMLSHDKSIIRFLNNLTKFRQGLFLIAGPTGSGKTTTLYSVLGELDHNRYNIVTLEDPIELDIPGVNQIQVDNGIGLNFGKMLRHVLRQDPDVILVGEIRDEESLKLVFEASLTGHLVLATIHATNSLDIFPRMIELGANPSQIATSLIGVMTQRLIRTVCTECKATRPITIKEVEILKEKIPDTPIPTTVNYGKGCQRCKGSGFFDRSPLFEFWKNDGDIKSAILSKNPGEEITPAILGAPGFKTLSQYGYHLVVKGLTTIEEVENSVFGL